MDKLQKRDLQDAMIKDLMRDVQAIENASFQVVTKLESDAYMQDGRYIPENSVIFNFDGQPLFAVLQLENTCNFIQMHMLDYSLTANETESLIKLISVAKGYMIKLNTYIFD